MRNAGESRKETCMRRRALTHPKKTVRVGCWNVHTMYSNGKTAQVCQEMAKYKVEILGKISSQVRHRRWKWIGHVLRMAPNRNPHVALSWAPSGKRSRGRPRETWRRTVEKERAELGLKSWAAAAAVAKNRDRWQALTSGPIPHLGARN